MKQRNANSASVGDSDGEENEIDSHEDVADDSVRRSWPEHSVRPGPFKPSESASVI
jgi:hypothetical protein